MFIQVRLLKGFSQSLWYQVPQKFESRIRTGSFVRVPIQKRVSTGIVCGVFNKKPAVQFQLKSIESLEKFPQDALYRSFIETIARYYQIDYLHCIKRIRSFFFDTVKEKKISDSEQEKKANKNVILSDEQQAVCDFLFPYLKKTAYIPTVLHGVTGSGKTEIYKKLIEETVRNGKTVIFLLPEVSLAVQFYNLFKNSFDESVPVFSFHSATSITEKRKLWNRLIEGKSLLIVGVHLPILLPISNLGLVIIDEEHATGFQEKKHPMINSKEAAIMRAHQYKIPILLGSATPSLASLDNVKRKGWHFFQLKKRFSGAFPKIKTVFMKEKQKRKSFWISNELEYAIKKRLEKKEQSIIFLNRRGYSFFVQCKLCSFIFTCPDCSVSLTLHQDNILRCHYCEYHIALPENCGDCKADQKKFLKKGIGTQQVVTILQKLFPSARIARVDLDTTVNRKRSQKTIDDFMQQHLDILVGTQTIAKGYHFPHVTLVGVLWADLNLNFPVYNAAEVTLQQLIQVAGRAGRQKEDSEVIIQTMQDHPIFKYISEVDYNLFYESEMHKRKEISYPPFIRFAEIELKSSDEIKIEEESERLIEFLDSYAQKNKLNVRVLGPAKPPVYKIKKTESRKIYLKSANMNMLIQMFQAIKKSEYSSSIFFVPNPMN